MSFIYKKDVATAILSTMIYKGDIINGNCNIWNLVDNNPAPCLEVMEFGSKLLEGANLLPERKKSSL